MAVRGLLLCVALSFVPIPLRAGDGTDAGGPLPAEYPDCTPRGAAAATVQAAAQADEPAARARALNAQAAGRYRTGDYAAAERLWREAVRLWQQAYPADRYPRGHPDLALGLSNLGAVLHEQGKLDEARAHLEQALAIRQKAPRRNLPMLALTLNNLGAVLQAQGKLEEARARYEQALALKKKAPRADPRDLASTRNNLGLLLRDLGKLEEARGHLEQALALRKKVLPADHPDLAISLHSLGALLREMGKGEEARGHLERALAIYRKTLPPEHPHLAAVLNSLGVLLDRPGTQAEARAYYEQALAIYRKALPPEHPQLATSQHNMGLLHWAAGRRDEGWALLAGAAGAWAGHHRRVAAGSAQRDHADLIRGRRLHLDTLLSAAAAGNLSDRQREELLLQLWQSKNISAAALGGRQALLSQADADARALAERLTQRQRRLADLLLQGPGRRSPQQYRDDCLVSQREVDDLERQLGQRLRPFALLRAADRATPQDLADRLPAGTVLVETVRYHAADLAAATSGAPRYAAVLLWSEGGRPQVRLLDLGKAAPLERAVATWRAAVQQGRADGERDAALRRRLWEPLAAALPAGARGLVVAPEGSLALLPFEALRLADGTYLVEKLKVVYVSCGRDLMPRPGPPEKPGAALILADPAYDAQASPEREQPAAGGPRAGADLPKRLRFRSLPGFAREADAVTRLLQGQGGWRVEARRGAEASEEALSKAARPRLLYCVTHGFFLKDVERSPDKPGLRDLELASAAPPRALPHFGADPRLRSGLALAGANQWQERSAKGLSDGLLTALEVENLDLWGTELVILSACETGLGEVQVGEGVLGLRRAFQLAGAQMVVASLWKVPDTETEQLMTNFLGRWLKGQGKAEALRAAQLEMIRTLRASPGEARREAPPLYWAGFICHGRDK